MPLPSDVLPFRADNAAVGKRRFEIQVLPREAGPGWQLQLYRGAALVGAVVFRPGPYPAWAVLDSAMQAGTEFLIETDAPDAPEPAAPHRWWLRFAHRDSDGNLVPRRRHVHQDVRGLIGNPEVGLADFQGGRSSDDLTRPKSRLEQIRERMDVAATRRSEAENTPLPLRMKVAISAGLLSVPVGLILFALSTGRL